MVTSSLVVITAFAVVDLTVVAMLVSDARTTIELMREDRRVGINYLLSRLVDLAPGVIFAVAMGALILVIRALVELGEHPETRGLLTFAPNTILIAPIAGVGFFSIRCRQPLFYGLVEIVAALVAIWSSTNPAIPTPRSRGRLRCSQEFTSLYEAWTTSIKSSSQGGVGGGGLLGPRRKSNVLQSRT